MAEQGTVDALREAGAADRLDTEGPVHHGIKLRFAGERHRIDFPALIGGRTVTSYARTETVRDLVGFQPAGGPPLLSDAQAPAVVKAESGRPVVRFRHEGRERRLTCDRVAGRHGSHGVARDAFPTETSRTYARHCPYSWPGILADVLPSRDELIYACGERGCALHGRRPPCPITAESVTPMRSHVHEPMRRGRLLLAGGAAHTVRPTGAKGLAFAVSDVRVLAPAFAVLHRTASGQLLDGCFELSLARVGQAPPVLVRHD